MDSNNSGSSRDHSKKISSFPSRQKRMGPAPLASFEDLSMDKTTTDSSPEDHRGCLSEIGEEDYSLSTSYKGGLDLPTSPRIRVSGASSPSQHESDSKDSTPEKELIAEYAKSEFSEEMADLKSSTQEIYQRKQSKNLEKSKNVAEVDHQEDSLKIKELIRKGSSSSVISDSLLPVTSAHSSRLSSLGSIGSARRSPSPHKMLLETSFCGNKPIQQPSIDIEDPPVDLAARTILGYALGNIETIKSPRDIQPSEREVGKVRSPMHDGQELKGEKRPLNSNGRSPRQAKKVPVPQVPDLKDFTSPISPTMTPDFSSSRSSTTTSESPKGHKKSTGKKVKDNENVTTDRKSSFTSLFKKSDASVSPGTPDSPGSGGGRKSPFSQLLSKGRSRSKSKNKEKESNEPNQEKKKGLSVFQPEKKKKQESAKPLPQETDPFQDGQFNDYISKVEFTFISESNQPQTLDSLRLGAEAIETDSKVETEDSRVNISEIGRFATFGEANDTIKEKDSNIESETKDIKEKNYSNTLDISNEAEQDSLSISESERGSEIDVYKKTEKTMAHLESPDNENKGLVSQDSFEDGELPYVPTTLPQERPIAAPLIPTKDRKAKLIVTQSIDRPRSATPLQPGRLEEYKQSSQELLDQEFDKTMISIKVPLPVVKVIPPGAVKVIPPGAVKVIPPGAVKVIPPGAVKVLPDKVTKRQDSKNWEEFCNEGLVKNPKILREQLKDKQQTEDMPITVSDTAPPPHSYIPSMQPRQWIDFEEMASVVLKPVRQIKTISQDTDFPIAPFKRVEPRGKEDSDKESSVHSSEESDDEKPLSASSSEELNTVRGRLEELKTKGIEDNHENSDLESLLAPVNDYITKLSSIASASGDSKLLEYRKSPIPDNWEEFLLPPQPGRRSRLSSIGSDAGSLLGRSPSPSITILETSFCGSQPIDDPASVEPSVSIPVARKLSGISLGDLSPVTPRSERGGSFHSGHFLSQTDRTSILSDSSTERGSPWSSARVPEHIKSVTGGQINPFGMDLEVKSNRSSIISPDQSPTEESSYSSQDHS